MSVIQKAKNALHLLLISFSFFKHISLLIYPLISIISYLLLEAFFLFLLYLRWGIHIFNERTFERWALISFWELSIIILLIVAPWYFINGVGILFAKCGIAHAVVEITKGKSPHVTYSLVRSFNLLYELVQFASLSTILIVVEEPGIKRFFKKKACDLGGESFCHREKIDTWLEKTFLVIPLIAFKNLKLKTAIKKSDTLMEKTFGSSTFNATFSFTYLMFIAIFIFGIITERFVSHYYNQAAGIAAFFAMAGIIMSLVRTTEGIFQAATYQYCMQQPTGLFSQEDFTNSFKPNAVD